MRNDILRRRARRAQVFAARPVDQRLGAGVGVNGRHGTHFNAECIVERFSHRRQAVGGARGDGNNLITGVQRVVVDVKDQGFHLSGWRGDQHFFSPGIKVRL